MSKIIIQSFSDPIAQYKFLFSVERIDDALKRLPAENRSKTLKLNIMKAECLIFLGRVEVNNIFYTHFGPSIHDLFLNKGSKWYNRTFHGSTFFRC